MIRDYTLPTYCNSKSTNMKIGLVVVVMVICAVMQVSSSLQLPPKQEVKQSPP